MSVTTESYELDVNLVFTDHVSQNVNVMQFEYCCACFITPLEARFFKRGKVRGWVSVMYLPYG